MGEIRCGHANRVFVFLAIEIYYSREIVEISPLFHGSIRDESERDSVYKSTIKRILPI